MSTCEELWRQEIRVLKAELKVVKLGLQGVVVTGKVRPGAGPACARRAYVDIEIMYRGKKYRSVNELVADVIAGPAQRARERAARRRRDKERAARAARLGARSV
jgi:hypothetical protein